VDILYKDLFECVNINKKLGREHYYKDVYPIISKRNNKFIILMVKNIINIIGKNVNKKNSDKYNILILEDKFKKIIEEQSDYYNFFIIYNSLSKYKILRKYNSAGIYSAHNWVKLVDKSFFTRNMKYAKEALDKVCQYLSDNSISIVLLGNDKLFLEKLILLAAKSINIPVVIIQHGVYTSDSFNKLKTACSADYFWAWSKYIKELYINIMCKEEDNVKVIGYPFNLYKKQTKDKNNVLFLGNQYADYNKEEGKRYLEIANMVLNICIEKKLNFTYRPHPSEKINEEYGDLKKYISKYNLLNDDLNANNIIVGDLSSAMVEAGLLGRHVIQIIWSERSKIAKSELTYNFTIKVSNNYQEIQKALLECVNNNLEPELNEYYIYIDTNFKKHVHELLEEIIKKRIL